VVHRRRSIGDHFRELTGYHELIYHLVVRELKARYKNSILGFFWSLLNPLAMMLVFMVVFGIFMPNNNLDRYPIFLLCGLLPWNCFQTSLMSSIGSIIGNANLVQKAYFPREVLPIAAVFAQVVNFLLALIVLFSLLILFPTKFSLWLLLLPFVIFMQTCFALGLSLILATLNVFYRDTMMIIDVILLAWFFLTPIFYPLDLIPASAELWGMDLNIHRLMYILNPMASIINTYRDLLYWGYRTDIDFLMRTFMTSMAVLIFGYWIFIRYSGRFGEEI